MKTQNELISPTNVTAVNISKRILGPAYHLVLVAAIGSTLVFMINQSVRVLLDASIVLLPAFGIIMLVAAISCVKRIGVRRDDRASIVWFSFFLATVLWFMGLLAFDLVQFVIFGMPPPTPSISDVFEMAGYVPFLFGLFLQVTPFRSALASKSMVGLITVVVVGSVAILYLVLPGFLGAGGNSLGIAVNAAYPVLDLISLSVTIPILVLFMRGTFWRPFLCIVVGLGFMLVADIVSGETVLHGTYHAGDISDLIYIYGLLAGTLGWHLRKKQFITKSL
jgi:hypothetical protein